MLKSGIYQLFNYPFAYWVTRLRETLQKHDQLNLMSSMLKTLSREINIDNYKCKLKFSQKRTRNPFIHKYSTLKLCSETASQTSRLLEIFKFKCSRQKYLNISNFVRRVAVAKIRSASCILAVFTRKWDRISLQLSHRQQQNQISSLLSKL